MKRVNNINNNNPIEGAHGASFWDLSETKINGWTNQPNRYLAGACTGPLQGITAEVFISNEVEEISKDIGATIEFFQPPAVPCVFGTNILKIFDIDELLTEKGKNEEE